MNYVNWAAIERLKKELRERSINTVLFRNSDCMERELYSALSLAAQLEGRTAEELEHIREHRHSPTGAQYKELHPGWKAETRQDQTILRRGFRMVEDVLPDIDPAVLNKWLNSMRKFRGKSADELGFIAKHGRDPETFTELAAFVADRQLMRPADCPYCRPAPN